VSYPFANTKADVFFGALAGWTLAYGMLGSQFEIFPRWVYLVIGLFGIATSMLPHRRV
jgi:hypothetical protein